MPKLKSDATFNPVFLIKRRPNKIDDASLVGIGVPLSSNSAAVFTKNSDNIVVLIPIMVLTIPLH